MDKRYTGDPVVSFWDFSLLQDSELFSAHTLFSPFKKISFLSQALPYLRSHNLSIISMIILLSSEGYPIFPVSKCVMQCIIPWAMEGNYAYIDVSSQGHSKADFGPLSLLTQPENSVFLVLCVLQDEFLDTKVVWSQKSLTDLSWKDETTQYTSYS